MLVGVESPEEAGTAALRVRAIMSSESREGEYFKSTLNEPIWSTYSITLTYPTRSHFQRTLNRERRGKNYDERCRSLGEEEE